MTLASERPDFDYEIANDGQTVMLTPMRESAKEWCRANLEAQIQDKKVIRKATPRHGRSYLFYLKRGQSLLGHLQHKAVLFNTATEAVEPKQFKVRVLQPKPATQTK